jgi:hypothetical protein
MLVRGFEDAYSRLISTAGETQTAGRPAFIPLFDALNWTVTIDFRLQQDRDDAEWWKQLPDGALVRAVRFARNRVHHQWADALGGPAPRERKPGSLPLSLPLPRIHFGPPDIYAQASWRWQKELPPPEHPDKRDPYGEQLYAEYLALRGVSETLRRLYALFSTLPEVEDGSTRGYAG